MLRLFSKHNLDQDRAFALYRSIVAQARHTGFYARHGVPDTVDGRFEMLVWHVILVIRRIKGDGGQKLAQKLFDILFADLDQSLREMGFGDGAVPRRIKEMAQAFYGRAAALDDCLVKAADEQPDDAAAVTRALEPIIARNLFPDGDADAVSRGLAQYFDGAIVSLTTATTESIAACEYAWPDPNGFVEEPHSEPGTVGSIGPASPPTTGETDA